MRVLAFTVVMIVDRRLHPILFAHDRLDTFVEGSIVGTGIVQLRCCDLVGAVMIAMAGIAVIVLSGIVAMSVTGLLEPFGFRQGGFVLVAAAAGCLIVRRHPIAGMTVAGLRQRARRSQYRHDGKIACRKCDPSN